jgi:hypothetical protein
MPTDDDHRPVGDRQRRYDLPDNGMVCAMSDDKEDFAEVFEVVAKIRPLLAGRSPAFQGSVIAELASIWLSGYIGENDEHTAKIRAKVLSLHMNMILDLTLAEDIAREATKH